MLTQPQGCFRQSISQATIRADVAQPIKQRKGQAIRPIHTGLEEEEGESRGGRNSEKTRDRQAVVKYGERAEQIDLHRQARKVEKKTSATRRRADETFDNGCAEFYKSLR
jgi:hypothetical protein